MDVTATERWAREQAAPWSEPKTGSSDDPTGPATVGLLDEVAIDDLRDALDRLDPVRWAHEFDGVTLRLRRGWQLLRLVIAIPLALWAGSLGGRTLRWVAGLVSGDDRPEVLLMAAALGITVLALRYALRYSGPTEVVISKRTGQAARGPAGAPGSWSLPIAEVDRVRYLELRAGMGRLTLGKKRILLDVHNRDRLTALEDLGDALAAWLDKDFYGVSRITDGHPYRS